MDPMTMLAIGSSIANMFGGMGGQGTQPQRFLHNQTADMLKLFLGPGAFNAGGYGDNFFFGGMDGARQFAQQPAPEMKAFETARPILEGMLTGMGPQFEHDIAAANSQGGRFSSGNAIMRGEALRHLYNQRTQTADTLFRGAGQAGNATFDRLMQLQSQRLQLLAGLFGMATQFGQGAGEGQNAASAVGGAGMDLAKLLAVLNQGNGSSSMPKGTTLPSGPTMV